MTDPPPDSSAHPDQDQDQEKRHALMVAAVARPYKPRLGPWARPRGLHPPGTTRLFLLRSGPGSPAAHDDHERRARRTRHPPQHSLTAIIYSQFGWLHPTALAARGTAVPNGSSSHSAAQFGAETWEASFPSDQSRARSRSLVHAVGRGRAEKSGSGHAQLPAQPCRWLGPATYQGYLGQEQGDGPASQIRRSMEGVRSVRRNPYPQVSVLPDVRHGHRSPAPSGQSVRKL
jgi:hypothetical protein